LTVPPYDILSALVKSAWTSSLPCFTYAIYLPSFLELIM